MLDWGEYDICRRGEIEAITPDDGQDGRYYHKHHQDTYKNTRDNGDSTMEIPEVDEETRKEERKGELEKDREDSHDLSYMPFDQVI